MRIEFKFNSRSSGQGVPEAIKLAEKSGGIIVNKYYKINFDSSDDKNLRKLFELVGNLKGSAISLNGGGFVGARRFFYAVNCPEKLLCRGICRHVQFGYHDIHNFLDMNSENIENGIFSTSEENLIKYMTDFLEMGEENQFVIDKKRFLEFFQIETEMEERFCEKYNIVKVEEELGKFPNEIKLVPYEEEQYDHEYHLEPKELGVENVAQTIIDYSKLSIELSSEEMIECSKALTLLISNGVPISVENADVVIYSFPLINKFILSKFVLISNYPDELDDEELNYIVKKDNVFFCASSSHSKLYFKLFDEDDSKIEEYFEILKEIK